MAKKNSQRLPPTPEAREQVLVAIQSSVEPSTAKQIAKSLAAPHKIAEADLIPILDEYVSAHRLHVFPPKTAKAKPRYWDRDAATISRAAALDAIQNAAEPLTAKQLAGKLKTPLKLTEAEATEIVEGHVSAGTVHVIPPATAKGKPRYWNRDVLEFGRLMILKALDAKGPQTEANLKKAAKGTSAVQLQQILKDAIVAGQVWRHPPVGKSKKELLGNKPPSPEPYLKDLGNQLAKIVAQLVAADVQRDDLRRACVQLLEAAGVPFASSAHPGQDVRPVQPAASADLIGLIRRIEPGADRGALVGSRDLRRAAKLEKGTFDRAVLELARQGRLSLHRHDYPASLSEDQRNELVTDGEGTYYVGMALRQNQSGAN